VRMARLQIVSVISCCVFLAACAEGNQDQPIKGVVGNLLQHSSSAPDFTLIDQNNASFHMAAMKGRVVLMSFIYTHCTDICPFIALKVKDAYTLLGNDASNVAFVAVTTDPKRDVPQVTAAYSKELGLQNVWHFVSGASKEVQAVWFSYGIGVTIDHDTDAVAPPKEEKESATSSQTDKTGAASTESKESSGGGMEMAAPTQGLSKSDLDLAGTLIDQFGGGYDVGHSAPFWIVDKRGLIRVGMDADATPADLVTNIRALLALK
jgi:cytochrome oxidase Cu insertion factor (SCO1/SenC/PrrC family)